MIPGVDLETLFPKVIKSYEEELSSYTIKKYSLNNLEYVFLIEDTTVVYVGYVDMGYSQVANYYILIEELLNNESISFNISGFCRKFHLVNGLGIKYVKFHGRWANPIRDYSDPQYRIIEHNAKDLSRWFYPSKAEYVNEKLPDLHLKKRYEDWNGFLFHAIFYELKAKDITGHAVYCTQNPAIHTIARKRVKDIENQGVMHIIYLKQVSDDTKEFLAHFHGPGAMVQAGVNCDYNMMKIFENNV